MMKCSFFSFLPCLHIVGICENHRVLAKSISSFFFCSKRNESIWYLFLQQELLHKCPLGNFSWRARFIYQHTLHSTTTTPIPSLHFYPIPKATTKTKKWRQANRDLLANLTNRQLIDITDTTHQNRDSRAEVVPDRAAAQSRERQGSVFWAPPPPPPPGTAGTTTTRTGWPAA